MTISLNDIRYFLEIAKTGNISRAAERLGLAQPSLSTALKKLEHEVGACLLVRSKTGVNLTKAGKDFFEQCADLHDHWQRVARGVRDTEDQPQGHYVIGCHPSVGVYSLPAILPELLAEFPGLRLSLVHDLSRIIAEQVVNFKIDFGIVVNPVKHPDLVITRLMKDRVTVFRPQDCEPPRNLFVDENLLQSQKILAKRRGSFARIITSSSLEVIAQLVASGAGYGILPTRVAQTAGKPLVAAFPDAYFDDQICLVSRVDAAKSPGHKAIRRVLKGLLLDA